MSEFRLRQNNQTVAGCAGPNADREIMHYAAIYRQDGEVTIQQLTGGRWRRHAVLCQWPLPAISKMEAID